MQNTYRGFRLESKIHPGSIGLPYWLSGKEPTCNSGDSGFNPWVEEISWRRARQPTAVFLPGESHGPRSLASYSPWGHKESDMTEHACTAGSIRAHFPTAGGDCSPCLQTILAPPKSQETCKQRIRRTWPNKANLDAYRQVSPTPKSCKNLKASPFISHSSILTSVIISQLSWAGQGVWESQNRSGTQGGREIFRNEEQLEWRPSHREV